MHHLLIRPLCYILFKFKTRGHLYEPVTPQILTQVHLQKCCNIIVRIVYHILYHVAIQASREPLKTSMPLISKGGYQPTLTNLNIIM